MSSVLAEGLGDQPSETDSDDDSTASSEVAEEADHFVSMRNNVHHRRHETDDERLHCGKLKSIFKDLRAADFTAAYAQGAERCDGCYRG